MRPETMVTAVTLFSTALATSGLTTRTSGFNSGVLFGLPTIVFVGSTALGSGNKDFVTVRKGKAVLLLGLCKSWDAVCELEALNNDKLGVGDNDRLEADGLCV